MSVIRRNRIAIAVAGGMATMLALVMWSSNAVGVQGGTNVSQAGKVVEAAAPGDYETVPESAPKTSKKRATEAPASTSEVPSEEAPEESLVSLVAASVDKMGDVVQDGAGRTLYRFDKDTAKPSKTNCQGACAELWPPLLSEGTPTLQGVDADLVGTMKRADGTEQVTLAGWPLYTYAKDEVAGQWKGQGVGETWFVVQPDGTRNVECLPPGMEAPAEY